MFFSSFFRFTDRGRRKIFYYLKPGIPSNILYVKGSVWQPYFNFRHRSQLLQVFHYLNALNITRHLQIHKLFKDSNLAYRKSVDRSCSWIEVPFAPKLRIIQIFVLSFSYYCCSCGFKQRIYGMWNPHTITILSISFCNYFSLCTSLLLFAYTYGSK